MKDLDYFLTGVKDLIGYLTALKVNYIGVNVDSYLKLLKDLPTNPRDFYDILIGLRSDLSFLMLKTPGSDKEIYPAVKVIDGLIRLVSRPQ